MDYLEFLSAYRRLMRGETMERESSEGLLGLAQAKELVEVTLMVARHTSQMHGFGVCLDSFAIDEAGDLAEVALELEVSGDEREKCRLGGRKILVVWDGGPWLMRDGEGNELPSSWDKAISAIHDVLDGIMTFPDSKERAYSTGEWWAVRHALGAPSYHRNYYFHRPDHPLWIGMQERGLATYRDAQAPGDEGCWHVTEKGIEAFKAQYAAQQEEG